MALDGGTSIASEVHKGTRCEPRCKDTPLMITVSFINDPRLWSLECLHQQESMAGGNQWNLSSSNHNQKSRIPWFKSSASWPIKMISSRPKYPEDINLVIYTRQEVASLLVLPRSRSHRQILLSHIVWCFFRRLSLTRDVCKLFCIDGINI